GASALRDPVVLVGGAGLDDLAQPTAALSPRFAQRHQLDDPFVGAGTGGEAHLEPVRRQRAAGHLAPFDQRDALLELLLDAELVELLDPLEPVDVDVAEADAPLVLPDERERRAHHRAVDVEPAPDALGQRRLAGAEFAGEHHDVACPQDAAPQLLAQGPGLLDGTADDLHGIRTRRAGRPGPVGKESSEASGGWSGDPEGAV